MPRKAPEYGRVQAAVVHHTVTANAYTPEQASAAVLGICRYHRNSNRWNDIGYNFLVDRFGTIYEGRAGGVAAPVAGAQAQGLNAETTGIANLGTYSTVFQSPEALAAIAQLIRWKLPLHGSPTAGTATMVSRGGETSRFEKGTQVVLPRIAGHRDINLTSCPGEGLFAQLGDLRARVGSVMPIAPPVSPPHAATPPRTRIEALVSPGVVRFGERPLVRGRLRLMRGDPVGAAPIEVQGLAAGAWRTLARTTSRDDGSFGVGVFAAVKRVLRVRFPGDRSRQSSISRRAVVLVRPTIAVRRSVRRAAVGRTPVVSGHIAPAKSRLVLVVATRARGGWRRIARVPVRARRGEFRKGIRLRRPGLHRVTVVFTGDPANLPVGSAPVHVRAQRGRRGGGATAQRQPPVSPR
jgi:hypothetical protein